MLCDLDGVVWLAHRPIEGAAAAVAKLRGAGIRVLFVTNNSASTVAQHEGALAAVGISAAGDVVSAAGAAASLVDAGETVVLCADRGVAEAVEARGATIVAAGPADVVIVGMLQTFDYRDLDRAQAAIRGGARFIATNDDATYPTPHGPRPGAGSLVAAVQTASGATPAIAGKPHRSMARLVRERCGPGFRPAGALMVGDRYSTDGRFAEVLGVRFALVRSGVTVPGDPPGGEPTWDLADLAAVARMVCG